MRRKVSTAPCAPSPTVRTASCCSSSPPSGCSPSPPTHSSRPGTASSDDNSTTTLAVGAQHAGHHAGNAGRDGEVQPDAHAGVHVAAVDVVDPVVHAEEVVDRDGHDDERT